MSSCSELADQLAATNAELAVAVSLRDAAVAVTNAALIIYNQKKAEYEEAFAEMVTYGEQVSNLQSIAADIVSQMQSQDCPGV